MANLSGLKYGGRKKGTPNSNNKILKELISNFLTDNHDEFLQNLSELPAKDYVSAYSNLLRYALPQMKAVEVKQEDTMPRQFEIQIIK